MLVKGCDRPVSAVPNFRHFSPSSGDLPSDPDHESVLVLPAAKRQRSEVADEDPEVAGTVSDMQSSVPDEGDDFRPSWSQVVVTSRSFLTHT